MTVTILVGDTRTRLNDLPDASVQCCVTSPPYFNLRDYGVSGQIGLEPTLAEYLAAMVEVFRGVRRVLCDDGTLWLNIGSSYGTNKCDLMVPARVALALIDDGWILRSDIIWGKTAPMPESVTDRPTSAHEHIFLLTKSARYYYDADAVRTPSVETEMTGGPRKNPDRRPSRGVEGGGSDRVAYRERGHSRRHAGFNDRWDAMSRKEQQANGANLRNVWMLGPDPFAGAHFAVMPREIPRRCIKAGSKPGDMILDPFGGSGTTGLVADELGRDCTLIELNSAYAELSRERIFGSAPLLAEVMVS